MVMNIVAFDPVMLPWDFADKIYILININNIADSKESYSYMYIYSLAVSLHVKRTVIK